MIKRNKKILLLISTIFTVVLALSFSYAFFYFSQEGNTITLTSGSIWIDFEENTNYMTLHDTYPKSDQIGKIDPFYYDFTVTGSKGEYDDILYEIQILEADGNTLYEEYVKVYLTDQEDTIKQKWYLLSELPISEYNGNRVIYRNFINDYDVTQDFRLRVWVDESCTENAQNTFNFQLILYGVNENYDEDKIFAVEFISDTLKKLVGTNGLVAVNTSGALAGEGDEIREYRYSGSAKYCTYTTSGKTYNIAVEGETCPNATYSGRSIYTCKGSSCDDYTIIPNQIIPIDDEVDNYIWFNNEMWRIIGVFKEITGSGKEEELVKIIRQESLTTQEVPVTYVYNGISMKMKYTSQNYKYAHMYWAYSNYFGQTNSNDWTKASLQYYLNDETVGAKSYYNSIDLAYREMIETVEYDISNTDDANTTTKGSYNYERSGNVWDGNVALWTGKIGMIYASDYGYAASSDAWDVTMGTYGESDQLATLSNWMNAIISDSTWTISPSSTYDSAALAVYSSGRVDDPSVGSSWGGYGGSPVLYLKSLTIITNGDGSESDPYQIALG